MQKNIIKKRLKQVFEIFDIKILDFELDKIIKRIESDDWYELKESQELENYFGDYEMSYSEVSEKIIYISTKHINEREREIRLTFEKIQITLYEVGFEKKNTTYLIKRLTSVFFS